MVMATCTMLRKIISARSVIIKPLGHARPDDLVQLGRLHQFAQRVRRHAQHLGGFLRDGRGHARSSGQRGDFAKLFARPGAAGDAVTPAFFALDHHPPFQDEERMLVRLALAQQHVARGYFQHRQVW